MKQNKVKLSRRNFLIAAGVGGAGAAAAVVAGTAGMAGAGVQPMAEAVAQPDVKGYHVSEHINKYYKTTLV
jgi:nitrous oxide reductase